MASLRPLSPPFLPPLPFPSLSSPPLPSFFIPLPFSFPSLSSWDVGPLYSSYGVWRSAVNSRSGAWGGAGRFWCILALKSKSDDNNFNDFLEKSTAQISSDGMAPPYQISDWYGGRHTCHTASGASVSTSNTLPLNTQQCATQVDAGSGRAVHVNDRSVLEMMSIHS